MNAMQTFSRHLKRWGVLTTICLMTFVNSGCTLTGGFIGVLYEYMLFWETLPVMDEVMKDFNEEFGTNLEFQMKQLAPENP